MTLTLAQMGCFVLSFVGAARFYRRDYWTAIGCAALIVVTIEAAQ